MGSAIKNIFIGALVGMTAVGLIGMALYFSLTTGAARPAPSLTPTSAVLVELVSTPVPSPTETTTPTITPTPTFTPIPTLEVVQYVSPTVTPSITPTVDAVQAA